MSYRSSWMTDELEIFRDQFRKFLAKDLAPHAEKWRAQKMVDRSAWRGLGEMGALLPSVPEQYGGLGATFAYHRDCFTTPGPIPSNILCEDGILPFRAALLGKVAAIPEPLVRYRVHEGSATAGARFMSPEYQAAHYAVIDAELDSSFRSGLIDAPLYERTKKRLARWPAFIDRCRRLSGRPMLARIHYAWYFSDVWVQRLLARLGRPTREATRT